MKTGKATVAAHKHDLVAGTVTRCVRESKSRKNLSRKATKHDSDKDFGVIKKEMIN